MQHTVVVHIEQFVPRFGQRQKVPSRSDRKGILTVGDAQSVLIKCHGLTAVVDTQLFSQQKFSHDGFPDDAHGVSDFSGDGVL